MAVIINDFEVVVDPPAPQGAQEPGEAQPAAQQQPTLTPADIERIVRHFEERRERVLAD